MITDFQKFILEALRNAPNEVQNGKVILESHPTSGSGIMYSFEIRNEKNNEWWIPLIGMSNELFDSVRKFFKEKSSKRIANRIEFLIHNFALRWFHHR